MKKLSKRETLLLKLLGGISAAAVFYLFIIQPVIFNSNASVETSQDINQLEVLSKLNIEHNNLKNEINSYNAVLNNTDDNMNTLVQSNAEILNISKNIEYTKRTQTNIQNKYVKITTDVKINAVTSESILQFISKIENNEKLVFVTYVNIHKGLKEKELYDVLLKINTFTKMN